MSRLRDPDDEQPPKQRGTEGLPMFDMPPPAQQHSPTSVAAADAIKPNAGTLREKVHEFLVQCGWRGATDEEIQDGLHMDPNTERPRRIELVKAGRAAGTETKRKTKSGRSAQVWRAKL